MSFEKNVIGNFKVDRVLANIDPIWGGDEDHFEVLNILEQRFENLEVFQPRNPSFGGAVKRLWQHTSSDLVFHLEEDWIALGQLTPEIVVDSFTDSVKSVALLHEYKNYNRNYRYHYNLRRRWYWPFKIQDKTKPHFSTSPSFWAGDFLRECADRMDPHLDPEKQFYSGHNNKLERYVSDKKCKLLFGNPYLVEDIGRPWQDKNGIKKVIVDGASHWLRQ